MPCAVSTRLCFLRPSRHKRLLKVDPQTGSCTRTVCCMQQHTRLFHKALLYYSNDTENLKPFRVKRDGELRIPRTGPWVTWAAWNALWWVIIISNPEKCERRVHCIAGIHGWFLSKHATPHPIINVEKPRHLYQLREKRNTALLCASSCHYFVIHSRCFGICYTWSSSRCITVRSNYTSKSFPGPVGQCCQTTINRVASIATLFSVSH